MSKFATHEMIQAAIASLGSDGHVVGYNSVGRAIESALAEARAAHSGEWVMVPREMTQEMIEADIDSAHAMRKRMFLGEQIAMVDCLRDAWAAMIAAAPPAPAAEPATWPTEAELIAFGTAEQHFLSCDQEDYAQIALEILAKFGRRLPPAAPPPVAKAAELVSRKPDGYAYGGWEVRAPGVIAPTPPEASQQQASGEKAKGSLSYLNLEDVPRSNDKVRLMSENYALKEELSRLTAELSAAKAEAEALRKDTERLDFVLYAGAFLIFKDADSGAKTCQLWVQDEDENHQAISGRDWFACPRAAIDAALAAQGSQRSENRNEGEKP